MAALTYAKPLVQVIGAFAAFQLLGEFVDRVTPHTEFDVKDLDLGFDPESLHDDPELCELLVRLKEFRNQDSEREEDYYTEVVKALDNLLHVEAQEVHTSKDKSRADTFSGAYRTHMQSLKRLTRQLDAAVYVRFEDLERLLDKKVDDHVQQVYRISSR